VFFCVLIFSFLDSSNTQSTLALQWTETKPKQF